MAQFHIASLSMSERERKRDKEEKRERSTEPLARSLFSHSGLEPRHAAGENE